MLAISNVVITHELKTHINSEQQTISRNVNISRLFLCPLNFQQYRVVLLKMTNIPYREHAKNSINEEKFAILAGFIFRLLNEILKIGCFIKAAQSGEEKHPK